MPRGKKRKVVVEPKVEEPVVEEEPKVEMDIMESETPKETVFVDPLAEARSHYVGQGSVSGEYLFDDVPGSIAANSLERALQIWLELPGGLKVPGSH